MEEMWIQDSEKSFDRAITKITITIPKLHVDFCHFQFSPTDFDHIKSIEEDRLEIAPQT